MTGKEAHPLFRFEGIQKSVIRGEQLLNIEVLDIESGNCLLLTGPNGVGKTTLLKMLSGLDHADSIKVYHDGALLPWKSARKHINQKIIYLHQQAYLFDSSVTENIKYGLRRRNLKGKEAEQRIASALERSGIDHLANRNARELSGGEKQRVALARALVLQPSVLLLDEPFSGLDESARTRVGFLIQRIKSEGVAIVITSHELQPVKGIADRHLELINGKVIESSRGVVSELEYNRKKTGGPIPAFDSYRAQG